MNNYGYFEECKAGVFKAFTSIYTTNELEAALPEKREKMLGLISEYNIIVLAANEEADILAQKYISEGALPKGSLTDASHIAVASLNDLDIIVSLNFRQPLLTSFARLNRHFYLLLLSALMLLAARGRPFGSPLSCGHYLAVKTLQLRLARAFAVKAKIARLCGEAG